MKDVPLIEESNEMFDEMRICHLSAWELAQVATVSVCWWRLAGKVQAGLRVWVQCDEEGDMFFVATELEDRHFMWDASMEARATGLPKRLFSSHEWHGDRTLEESSTHLWKKTPQKEEEGKEALAPLAAKKKT